VSRALIHICCLCAALLLAGCGTYPRHGLDPARAAQIESAVEQRWLALSRENEERILALDPAAD
jgi:hypothetical protein